MNDFLGKHNLLKLTQEEVEDSSRPLIIEEIGNAVRKTTQNKEPVKGIWK